MDLLDNYANLTVSEKKVVDYIYNNLFIIPSLSIKTLSNNLHISKTTIINLCQKLGFKGFRELKFYIENNILEENANNNNVSSSEDIANITSKTMVMLSERSINKAVELINNANSVFIIARGTSKAVAYYLEHMLLILNKPCIFINDYNLLDLYHNFVSEKDLVVCISLSGKTEKIVESTKRLSIKNVPLIGVTSFHQNPLSEYVDVVLQCYAHSTNTTMGDAISRLGFFVTIDVLVNALNCSIK